MPVEPYFLLAQIPVGREKQQLALYSPDRTVPSGLEKHEVALNPPWLDKQQLKYFAHEVHWH
eukprot:scaffold253878_cov18-Tisochrysis_lutea.AAC.3